MKTFAIATLGCKVNTVESEDYIQSLIQKGYKQVDFKEQADIYVVNTCAVTQHASAKSRQKISQAIKHNPHAQIVVVGCLVSVNQEEILNMHQDAILINQQQKKQFDQLVLQESLSLVPVKKQNQTRAFLKIQDGCEQFCSFCIIPLARGKEQSVAIDQLVATAKSLAHHKHKEIVLTGIHLGRYGKNNQTNLVELCKQLSAIPELARIRISSIEVSEISDDLINLMAHEPKLAKHLHIPLQSGSDTVLKRMNRPYTSKEYADTILKLRQAMPDIAISTDVMAGFVGESEAEFNETISFIKQINFSFLHVFPYSKRENTKAASMENHIAPAIIKARAQTLFDLSKQLRHTNAQALIGKEVSVLFEKHTKFGTTGYSEHYYPMLVHQQVKLNELMLVKVEQITDNMIIGRVVSSHEAR